MNQENDILGFMHSVYRVMNVVSVARPPYYHSAFIANRECEKNRILRFRLVLLIFSRAMDLPPATFLKKYMKDFRKFNCNPLFDSNSVSKSWRNVS